MILVIVFLLLIIALSLPVARNILAFVLFFVLVLWIAESVPVTKTSTTKVEYVWVPNNGGGYSMVEKH